MAMIARQYVDIQHFINNLILLQMILKTAKILVIILIVAMRYNRL